MQTMMRSPSSIMLKSVMARPTSRHRRFSSLMASRSALDLPAAGGPAWAVALVASAISAWSSRVKASSAPQAAAVERDSWVVITWNVGDVMQCGAPANTARAGMGRDFPCIRMQAAAAGHFVPGAARPRCLRLPLAGFDADGHFAVVKNFQLGNFHAHAHHAGQLHQALGQFADQAFEQIDMLGGALFDDDLAHLAVIEHMADIVVLRAQGLRPLVEFGINLNGLGRGFFVRQDAQIGRKAQPCQSKNLGASGRKHTKKDAALAAYIKEKSRSKRCRCCPPSTNKLVPVMERFSRAKRTVAATSSGLELRPSGLRRCSCSNFS